MYSNDVATVLQSPYNNGHARGDALVSRKTGRMARRVAWCDVQWHGWMEDVGGAPGRVPGHRVAGPTFAHSTYS